MTNQKIETIVEQIRSTQEELEKLETKKQQKEHQLEKLQGRDRSKERKARTRSLIERGAILESVQPSIKDLSNEQLQIYLDKVLHTVEALVLLIKMVDEEVAE